MWSVFFLFKEIISNRIVRSCVVVQDECFEGMTEDFRSFIIDIDANCILGGECILKFKLKDQVYHPIESSLALP